MICIGLDIGSTAVKAVAVDGAGRIRSRGKCAYPTLTRGAESTQRAYDWWSAAITAVRQTVAGLDTPDKVAAISTSSQGGSILAADSNYIPICDAMTWMDRRAVKESEELAAAFGDSVYRMCGWRSAPSDCASKLLWMRRNKPEIFGRAAYFLTTEEYINYRLSGNAVTDPTGAAITRLYNINSGAWDARMLDCIGLDAGRLPRVLPAGTFIGGLTPGAADELGLDTGVAVYNGAHDQYCASIGSGVTKPGELLLATGTAWVIFGVTDSLSFNERYTAPGLHPVSGRYGAMATLAGIGAAVDNHAADIGDSLAHIDEIAAGRRESASELLICPCPPGKCFVPHRDNVCGAVYGRTDAHDGYDCALAMMEGAAFEVKLAISEFGKQGIAADGMLTMSGGAARSRLWSGLVSHICDAQIMLTSEHDTPALGAAMTAAVSCGAFGGYAECAGLFVRKTALPKAEDDESVRAFYRDKFNRYRKWCII